jgi:hypothetical protein
MNCGFARNKEQTMTQIVVDDVLLSKLHNISRPLELCDKSGRVLGRVFPALDLTQYEPLEPQVSEEELDRREKANEKRYITAEVLTHLEKL